MGWLNWVKNRGLKKPLERKLDQSENPIEKKINNHLNAHLLKSLGITIFRV